MERRKVMSDKKKKIEITKSEIVNDGTVQKTAEVERLEVTDKELEMINKHTLEDLSADDVYLFKAVITQNTTDRDFEYFTAKSIKQMADAFIGRPLIKDHTWSAESQIGRIYKTELIESDELTEHGEKLTKLVAHAYILDTDANTNLIYEIKGGIKKEVSIGVSMKVMECNICGKDNRKEYCEHFWGREYDGKTTVFKLDDLKDAYELSFVAVPAMEAAGVTKRMGLGGASIEKEADEQKVEKDIDENVDIVKAQIEILELETYIEQNK